MGETRIGLQPMRPTVGQTGASAAAGQLVAGAGSSKPLIGRANLSRIVPPFLYLPVRETAAGERLAEVRELTGGRQAVLAFTALDRLLLACGEKQLWAVVMLEALETIRDEQPFDTVAFDPEIPAVLLANGRLK